MLNQPRIQNVLFWFPSGVSEDEDDDDDDYHDVNGDDDDDDGDGDDNWFAYAIDSHELVASNCFSLIPTLRKNLA